VERHQSVTETFELPSGRKVVMRELTGEDEMAASAEAGEDETPAGRYRQHATMMMRAVVSIDGQAFDRSTVADGVGFRNLWSPREWQLLMRAFGRLHNPTKEDVDSFLGASSVSV